MNPQAQMSGDDQFLRSMGIEPAVIAPRADTATHTANAYLLQDGTCLGWYVPAGDYVLLLHELAHLRKRMQAYHSAALIATLFAIGAWGAFRCPSAFGAFLRLLGAR